MNTFNITFTSSNELLPKHHKSVLDHLGYNEYAVMQLRPVQVLNVLVDKWYELRECRTYGVKDTQWAELPVINC